MPQEEGPFDVTYKLYHALELRPPCTDEDVTRAYRRLALKYHPDKATGSQTRFESIKTAYDILKDPMKREFYDRFGDNSLKFFISDGTQGSGVADTQSFVGKSILKIIIRPTRLIPVFLSIAALGILFVLFLNFLDKKLYYSGLKTTPWYWIFEMLWTVVFIFFLGQGLHFYLNFKMFKQTVARYCSSEEYTDLPAPRRRFLAFIMACKKISSSGQFLFGALFLIYCTGLLAFNMDDNGKLINGMNWTTIFNSVVILFGLTCFVEIILNLFAVFRFTKESRLWKQRALVFTNEIYSPISSLAFVYFLSSWLDSPDRDLVNLLLIFSLMYLRIIFNATRTLIETKWICDDLERFLLLEDDPERRAAIHKKIKSQKKWTKVFVWIVASIFLLTIGLLHSHISGYWPQSWSMTFSPILINVFCSIFVFGLCCPCVVTFMEMAYPMNSFDTFVPASSGAARDEGITVIEIPSIYKHGYGFAPLQRRIKHK